jgi:hypothetical protein
VPGTKAAALKYFQAATAEPHAATPDWSVMTETVKPEITNVRKLSWTVVRGILTAILESEDTIIVAVLGIIYAAIRSAALFQYFTITQMACGG